MHCNYFSAFFYKFSLAGSFYGKDKEDYNPLDYFRMEIIEEISFFFFDREDSARSQKTMCRNDAEVEKQGAQMAKKKRLKSTSGFDLKI